MDIKRRLRITGVLKSGRDEAPGERRRERCGAKRVASSQSTGRVRPFLGFPETLHVWPLGTEKYPGILVMNIFLDFIQLGVVPLNSAPGESHVIYYLLFIQAP